MCMVEYPTRRQIALGSTVSIETKENQGSGLFTVGIVNEILTSSESHPHGIKVRLVDGQVGRVKKIKPSSKILKQDDSDRTTIPETENNQIEFKECYQYDKKFESSDIDKQTKEHIKRSVQERFTTAICSFANSRSGGSVYLGIDRNGEIVGLERDLKLGEFSDYEDSFANHIRDRLSEMLKDKTFIISKIRMNFRKVNRKLICIIQVLPSDQPIFLHTSKGEMFYVRGSSPRAEKLTGRDQFRYIKNRFPNYV